MASHRARKPMPTRDCWSSGHSRATGQCPATSARRFSAAITHFMTVTYWESEDSVRAFAGDDVLTARYFPEDDGYLLAFEPFVQHYTVAAVLGAA